MADENTGATEVKESLISRKLQLAVHDGMTVSGAARIKTRSFNNINADATVDDMHSTAVALASLMDNELANVYYDDKKLLQEVEISD